MFNFSNPGEIILYLIALVISLTIHEYSHGLISAAQGDDTPRIYGRLTLNPLAHMDLLGFITLFLFRFGWAKPVPISSRNYKNPRLGVILTSIAGPLSNLILAFISVIFFVMYNGTSAGLQYFLSELVFINISLAIFNIIPVPPLDGSKIFGEIFGGKVAYYIYKIDRVGMIVLFLALSIPQVNHVLSLVIVGVANIMQNIVYSFV